MRNKESWNLGYLSQKKKENRGRPCVFSTQTTFNLDFVFISGVHTKLLNGSSIIWLDSYLLSWLLIMTR